MKKPSWVLEAPATDFDGGVWGLTLIARLYNGEIDKMLIINKGNAKNSRGIEKLRIFEDI